MSNFTLHDLEKRVRERAQASADVSYTRKLIDRGVAHCAKKLGEEAVETVIAAVEEDRERLTAEAADLIYHLLVVLAARDITLAEVEAVLAARTQAVGPRGKGVAQSERQAWLNAGTFRWSSGRRTTGFRPIGSFPGRNGRSGVATRR